MICGRVGTPGLPVQLTSDDDSTLVLCTSPAEQTFKALSGWWSDNVNDPYTE